MPRKKADTVQDEVMVEKTSVQVDSTEESLAGEELTLNVVTAPKLDNGEEKEAYAPAEERGADAETESPVPNAMDGSEALVAMEIPEGVPVSHEALSAALKKERGGGEPADNSRTQRDDTNEQDVANDTPAAVLPADDRRHFFAMNFHELDHRLTPEERQEWNSIYASYRGRSALSGTIIGVDPHSIVSYDPVSDDMRKETMFCAIVVPYRVRIVIPESEMWMDGEERPDYVLKNMVGAEINFIITKVDREAGFAIASRKQASRVQRIFFSRQQAIHALGARTECHVLAVGPRRCLVECYGHDVDLTQREMRYTAIPDLRDEYRPGQTLPCIVKEYAPDEGRLMVSVKETESNPFEGAEFRHPVGCRRQAVIAGKYGGGVFCNLPDGTVCMCNYSYQHQDSDFLVGDVVMVVVQRYELEKQQMYGKILSKW